MGTTSDTAGSDTGAGVTAPAPGPPAASLSPSRAADFMTCPLLYRFRVIDKLPEKPSAAATRGTVVHAVLERLFDAPMGERTPVLARSLVQPEWEKLLARRPELVELFPDEPGPDDAGPQEAGAAGASSLARWLAGAEELLERYFTLEDPNRLQPAERELRVETVLETGLRLRGYVDRLDIAPDGALRIVDYKTGKAPPARFQAEAMFQMKFYALVLWRLRGAVPRRLQLVYLGSGDVVSYDPDETDLRAVERKLLALWEAIALATRTGQWRPRRNRLCDWCDHRALCPEYGGTPPPYPLPTVSGH
ncbi:recombinase RecB [Wenjunlia vitaminophila]|uniref:Recombinase RecB n=1 Tax=Wenjunlia vitaminophila TaxID=76728 RepID=A0A0T6LW24_WENVI|nr:RecB family exonuclease [Wenjunlia vitaminophila]KRV50253.1 recombinase RecB [Wenjunlia vitaminophila]